MITADNVESIATLGGIVLGGFAIAYGLIGDALRHRFARRCPKCGYPIPDAGVLRCSECGYRSQRPWRFHTLRVKFRSLAVGVLVCVLVIGPGRRISEFHSRGWIAMVPTALLSRTVSLSIHKSPERKDNGEPPDGTVHRELISRIVQGELSDAELQWLARRIVADSAHLTSFNARTEIFATNVAFALQEAGPPEVLMTLRRASFVRFESRDEWPEGSDVYAAVTPIVLGRSASPHFSAHALARICGMAGDECIESDTRPSEVDVFQINWPWSDGLVRLPHSNRSSTVEVRTEVYIHPRDRRTFPIDGEELTLVAGAIVEVPIRRVAGHELGLSLVNDKDITRLLRDLEVELVVIGDEVQVIIPMRESELEAKLLSTNTTLALTLQLLVNGSARATGVAWWGQDCKAPFALLAPSGEAVRLRPLDDKQMNKWSEDARIDVRLIGDSEVALRHFCAGRIWAGDVTLEVMKEHVGISYRD